MRIQFELSEGVAEFLDGLKKDLGLASRTDAIRHSLNLMKLAVKEIEEGNTFGSYNAKKGVIREVVIPGFEILKIKAKSKNKK